LDLEVGHRGAEMVVVEERDVWGERYVVSFFPNEGRKVDECGPFDLALTGCSLSSFGYQSHKPWASFTRRRAVSTSHPPTCDDHYFGSLSILLVWFSFGSRAVPSFTFITSWFI